MGKKQKILLLSFVLFVSISQNIIYGQEVRTYYVFKPQAVIDPVNHTLYKLANDFFVYEDWYEIKGKNERCLLGVLKKGKEFQTTYRSEGKGDSYYLKLSFFKTNRKNDPVIILGETGAEYSWGIHVFLVKETIIHDIGFLNVGAELKYDHGDTVVSAIPYIKVTTDGKRFKFTFTKDMVYENADFDLIKKENIYYHYCPVKDRIISTDC
jgi:hypothetical protein